MSKKVDERVVEMRFDNKQFESATKESMSTLDKLKEKLKLKDASKGLDDLEKAARKVDLNPLGKAADAVAVKFSYMQSTIQHQLNNIVDSAVNAGKNIVKALTIEPVMTGFQEYNTQMGAIQTILANTQKEGTNVQQVNAALDELNLYADQTIYNFTEMTKNIGTFTAAGVKLNDSVSAIKGIANLAAVSGSTSLQASTAMYQLSQALAAGKVTLMDWNSVVNAGMGGQVFQDALVRTSENLKTGAKQAIATYGTFRESLTKGEWLTKEVLTETLAQLSGAYSEADLIAQGYNKEQAKEIAELADMAVAAATEVKTFPQLWDTLKESVQSGWGVTWRTIIGDFEEAKILLTDISTRLSGMIEASSSARNKLLGEGLSSGWKQLMDAGIPNEEDYTYVFKSIAKEHGTSIDEMIKAEQKLSKEQNGRLLKDGEAFQKALKRGFSEGTLSADMLTESVHKLTDGLDGMSEQELKTVGYTSEQVKQLKALSDGLKDGSVSMDEFVTKITRTSGRENLIQALWNSFDGLMNILSPIKEAFREVFPATTGEQLYDLTVKIENVTAKFKELTEKNAPQLKATFKGIFSVISVGVNIIKAIVSGITTLIGKLTGLSGGFLDITGSIGEWLSKMSAGINEANLFGKAIDGIVGFLSGAIDKFKEFTGAIGEKVSANGFEWFFELMQKIGNVIQRISKAVGTVAVAIGKALGNAFSNGDFKSLLDILNGGLFASILLGIKKYISGITDKFDNAVGIVDKIKEVLGSVEDSLKSWQQNLQSGTIKNIAIAIGILAASLWVLSGIDSDKMGTALGGIGVLMGELMGAMFLFTKITADAKSALKGIPALIGIAAAIFILASALKKLADLNWGQLAVGLTGVSVLVGVLTGAMVALLKFTNTSEKIFNVSKKGIFSKKSQNHLISVGLTMIAMAAAMKILASACKDLSELKWDELKVGLTGIVVLLGSAMGAMITLSKTTSNSKGLMTIGLTMIAMAAAMKILASACKDLSELKWDELKVGLTGMVAMLGVVTGAMIALSRFTSKTGEITKSSKDGIFNAKSKQNLISIGLAMVAMAAAMKIMASAANDFAEMKWDGLAKAGAAMTVILGLSTLFLKFAGKAENMKASIGSLLLIGAAMEIFAHVAGIFGNMEWPDLGKAGLAITGILALVTIFAKKVDGTENILASAGALLMVAGAFLILTPVLKTLGSMSLGQIATALIALTGALAIFIGAAALIDKFELGPALYSLAGSIALIGLACLAAGAGLILFAAGFTALAAAGAAGATSFVAAITIIIVGILNLIPSIIDQLTAAGVALLNVIIQLAPAMGEAFKALLLTAIDVLVECVPALVEGFFKLLTGVLEALVTYTPQLVDLILNFTIALLDALTARLPDLMDTVANLIVAFINGLASHVPEFIDAGVNLFGAVIEGIANAIGPIVEKIVAPIANVLGNILIGLVKAIAPYMPSIIESIGVMIDLICEGIARIIDVIGPFLPDITNLVEVVVNGITKIVDAVAYCVPYITAMIQTLFEQISPIIDSIGELIRSLGDVIADVGEAIRNYLDGLAGVFDSAFGGIADVINSVGDTIEKFLNGIANIIDSVGEAALNAGTGFEKLANGIAIITNLKLADMAASLAAVGVGLGKIVTESAGISDVGTAMANIASGTKLAKDAFDSIASGISTIISSFSSIAEAANAATTNMVNTFINAKEPVVSAITGMLMAGINTMNEQYVQFYSAASYLVDGFAKGITENTFKAEAKARDMADAALTAARAKLKVESPSKEFAKMGAYTVEGFAIGINKNLGYSEKASSNMANGVLDTMRHELDMHSPSKIVENFGKLVGKGFGDGIEKEEKTPEKAAKNMSKKVVKSTKKQLKIKGASPSIVFDEEVGRYIAKGIANGITKDMSAEEAAKKKADNIVSAFQSELDRIEQGISNRGKDFDLWQLTDGNTASDAAVFEKERKKLNDDLWDYNKEVQMTTDKYEQLKSTFGEEATATQEAYGKMLDAQITAAQTVSSLLSIDKSIITNQEEHLDNWKTIGENSLEIMELASSNGYIVSNAYKDSRYLDVYKDIANIAKTKMDNAKKAYDEAFAKYGDINHLTVQEANIAYQEAYKEWFNAQKTYTDYEDSIVDRELQNIEDSRSHREDIIARWEAKYGDDASDKQRYLFYKNMYDTDSIAAWKEYRVYLKQYEDFVKKLAEKNNITIEEAKKLDVAVALYNNVVYPAETKAMEADKKVSDLRKDFLEQQKEDLKEEYETASDIADLKYQIWEKTTGRDATDTEKDTMKLAFLTEQLGQQAKLVKMAKEAWRNAKDDEKLKYEKEYYNAQLELANLQSEVLDIQEENAKRQEKALDRQRLAQDDYNDYIKKYEKYYLDHGMTREELEKDAKLVSGYDPNKAIKTAVSKTNTAIDAIKTNMSKITEAVGEGIQNGVSTVTDSTTAMLDSCADVLNQSKESWTKAGIVLVVSFISGIQSKLEDAVQAGFELASKTLEAMLSVIDSDMDYSPTITPVLDMSKVSAGASKLNSILTGNTSLGLAKSIASSSATKARKDVYAEKLAEGNGPRNLYSFTQNNYSPKSLSSTEIYRQTSNFISRIGKKVTE